MENKNINVSCKVVFGSWKAYNECNKRALGSKYLDLDVFNTYEKIIVEMKKEGFTSLELEETFIQDYEANGFDDVLLFNNCDNISIVEALELYQKAKKEVESLTNPDVPKLNYTLNINQYKAVEVHFNEKPNNEVITLLKANGFRWFFKSTSWNAFKTIEEVEALLKSADLVGSTIEVNKTPDYQYKSLVVIDDFEEKYQFIKSQYSGNYIENMRYSKNPKNVEYFNKHIMNETLVLKTKDNYMFRIDIDKPSIESQLWYDDETKSPENTYSNFENYNLMHNFRNNHLNDVQMLCYSNGYTSNDKVEVLKSAYGLFDFTKQYIRDLTEEEKSDFKHIYQEAEETYKKRLASYWKRYQNKIHWSGYWVNA